MKIRPLGYMKALYRWNLQHGEWTRIGNVYGLGQVRMRKVFAEAAK